MNYVKLCSAVALLLFVNFSFSQITVKIENLQYANGTTIGSGSNIEIDENGSERILFTAELTKSSNIFGSGTLRTFTKRNAGAPANEVGVGQSINDISWTTFFSASKDITLSASSFDATGGVFYAEFETSSGLKYKSADKAVIINEAAPDPDPVEVTNTICCDQIRLPGPANTITGNAIPSGVSGTYQWQRSIRGRWTNLSSETGQNYRPVPYPSPRANQYYFRRVIKISGRSDIISNSVNVVLRGRRGGSTAGPRSSRSSKATAFEGDLNLSQEASQAFFIYPNPSKDVIQFSSPQDLTQSKITIYDLSGKAVPLKIPGSLEKKEINISAIPKGKYIIVVEGKDGKVSKQFVKD